MKNTIIYIGAMYLPDQNADAQRALAICKSFRDIGYKVIMVGIDLEKENTKDILDTKRECFGFTAFSVAKPKTIKQLIHYSISIKEIRKVIEYYRENIFAVIALEHEAIALLKLISYCKKNNLLFVADAEEWYGKSNFKFPMNLAKNFDTWLRMRYIYPKKVKNMICISRFFERYYERYIPNRVLVPGTIDKNDEKWKEIEAYVPNSIFTLGYAGSPGLKMEKERLDWLLQAVKELNQEGQVCCLKIAGVDQKTVDDILKEKAINYNIQAFGRIPHMRCLQVIATCDFSVIVREDKRVTKAGFPTKLSESFGCGTPVISTKTSNIAEFIVNGKNGFLCDGFSKDALKDSIIKAMNISQEELITMHRTLKEEPILQYDKYNQDLKNFFEKIGGGK